MTKLYNILSKQGNEVALEVNIKNKKHDIFFRVINDANVSPSLNNTAIASMLLLPLMKNNAGELNIEGPLSSKLLANIDTLQDIYTKWNTDLHLIKIKGTASNKSINKDNRVGAFFTGGVDSFYTLLKHKSEITDLIFIHGYDIKLEETRLREEVSRNIRQVAKEFGKNLIEIETNLRSLLDSSVRWAYLGHGPALAIIGHLLSEYFSKIFVPSTHTYAELFPWGSHPLIDPLWSSDSLTFVHDGCEANRVDKVALVSKSDVALNHLRVCYESAEGSYNCCKCDKCLITMISLKAYNILEKCPTFKKELDYNLVAKIQVDNENRIIRLQENIDILRDTGKDKELEKILTELVDVCSDALVIKEKIDELKGLVKEDALDKILIPIIHQSIDILRDKHQGKELGTVFARYINTKNLLKLLIRRNVSSKIRKHIQIKI